jgi:hypothetical protein
MSRLENTWLVAGWAGLWYLWLKAAAEKGVDFAQNVTWVVDNVASETLNVLEWTFSEIWNLAPVSQNFINELGWILAHSSLVDLGIATWVGLWAWWLWKKGSQALWKITGIESDHDNNISKIWIWAAWALWVLWASASAITIGSGTAGYVLGRKLWEKVLGEKYAKITWAVWAVWWVWIALGASSWAVLWLSATALWAGFIWKWLWVIDNWNQQKEKRKNQWTLKAHFWIWRWKK